MRTSGDVIRSLKRYTALALPDWEVRLLTEEGTFTRPIAQILNTTPEDLSGPRWVTDHIESLAIHAFPEPGEDVQESLGNAIVAGTALKDAFRIGVDEGRPMRVPLYDYDGVAWDEGTDARNHCDYARVLDLSVERVQSPSDELLFTVHAQLRLAWRSDGEPEAGGPTAEELRVAFE